MKRFSFRLQRVLDVKNVMEDLRKRELRTANFDLQQQTGKLASLHEQHGGYQQTLKRQFEQPVTPQSIMLTYQYLQYMGKSIDQQKVQVDNAQSAVQSCTVNLQEAYKEKKILEQYKDKCQEEYKQDFEREETAFIDEAVNSRRAMHPVQLLNED
jgi:flagellar FliJ protein